MNSILCMQRYSYYTYHEWLINTATLICHAECRRLLLSNDPNTTYEAHEIIPYRIKI